MTGDGVFMYAAPFSPAYREPTFRVSPCVPPQTITPGEIRRIVREELERFGSELRREMDNELARAVREDMEYTCPACLVRDKDEA